VEGEDVHVLVLGYESGNDWVRGLLILGGHVGTKGEEMHEDMIQEGVVR